MHFVQTKAGCKPCATFIALTLSQADCHIPTGDNLAGGTDGFFGWAVKPRKPTIDMKDRIYIR